MIRRKLMIIGCFAAIAILALSAVVIAFSKTNSSLYASAVATQSGNSRIDNATYSVLKYCMPTLPKGSQTCDSAVGKISYNCDNLFKVKPDSCSDERITRYLDARHAFDSADYQGKPLPPVLTQGAAKSGA
ncbi:MAG: hypothetical protein ABI361_09265 [Nitrososphaera sp.]